MADRKKVQKIRTKRAVKSKTSKRRENNPTQPIVMSSSQNQTTQNSANSKSTPREKTFVNKTNVYKAKTKTSTTQKPTRNYKKTNGFSVIHGKKGELQKKKIVTLCISFIVILSILIFCLTSPTGPIERTINAIEMMGSDEFPTVLSGTKLLGLQTVGNKAFALTNSHLCGYTVSGKNFFELQHNFSNPVLDISKERVLIYNRENNKFIISNNSGTLFEQSLEHSVYCADIAYNGSVAFACESTSYASQILVFNRNMKQYYTWYLADGLVSDITVSDNGKYVAVAVLKVKNGAFVSQIYCLNTKEKEPVFTKELSNETVLKIESVSSSKFVYTSDKKVAFVEWKTGEEVNKNDFGTPSYFNNISNYYLALFGEANHSDIVLFNSSGKVKHQFEFNGIIDDISIFDDTIYILSGNKVTYFDFSKNDRETLTLESNADFVLGINDGFVSFNNTSMTFVSTETKNQ